MNAIALRDCRRSTVARALCCAVMLWAVVAGPSAAAESYPSRPVRLIATYPPGGSSDLMARILGNALSEIWGEQVFVDNKPGAAGSIGMDYAARQLPDGYTFVIGNLGPVAVNPFISKVPYDVLHDFVPVSMICTGPNILVVNASSPIKTVQDLVTAARAKPGTLNFGSGGPGSLAHLAGEMLKRMANIDIVHVPYKGGILSVNDLMAGQVQMVFSDALPVMQPIRGGRLRAIAITGPQRSPLLPDVPTFAELGYPRLVAVNWWGALLPAGTPKPIVDALHDALGKALATEEVKQRFAQLGVEAGGSTEDEFGVRIRAEIAKYSGLVQEAGIHAD
jgi:tripartite-type tricarboxylate transporter receptor subunit TctC